MASWVAPHAGAWIETQALPRPVMRHLSPPMRGRGLKQGGHRRNKGDGQSPPMWGRGLKLPAG